MVIGSHQSEVHARSRALAREALRKTYDEVRRLMRMRETADPDERDILDEALRGHHAEMMELHERLNPAHPQ